MQRHRRDAPPPSARKIEREGELHPSVRRISQPDPSSRRDVTDEEIGATRLVDKGIDATEPIERLAGVKPVSDE